jgi:hypothetical protein
VNFISLSILRESTPGAAWILAHSNALPESMTSIACGHGPPRPVNLKKIQIDFEVVEMGDMLAWDIMSAMHHDHHIKGRRYEIQNVPSARAGATARKQR